MFQPNFISVSRNKFVLPKHVLLWIFFPFHPQLLYQAKRMDDEAFLSFPTKLIKFLILFPSSPIFYFSIASSPKQEVEMPKKSILDAYQNRLQNKIDSYEILMNSDGYPWMACFKNKSYHIIFSHKDDLQVQANILEFEVHESCPNHQWPFSQVGTNFAWPLPPPPMDKPRPRFYTNWSNIYLSWSCPRHIDTYFWHDQCNS